MKLHIRIAVKSKKKIKLTDKLFDSQQEFDVESDLPIKENQELKFVSAKKETLSDMKFKPTEGMASEAKKALNWRKEGHKGGTLVGLARANQLAKRENLSAATVKRMHSFFSRHEVDKKGKGFYPGEGFPSKGRVAWAMWGGDAGQGWARKMSKKIKSITEKK